MVGQSVFAVLLCFIKYEHSLLSKKHFLPGRKLNATVPGETTNSRVENLTFVTIHFSQVPTCKIKAAQETVDKDPMVFITRARKEAEWDFEDSLRVSGWC